MKKNAYFFRSFILVIFSAFFANEAFSQSSIHFLYGCVTTTGNQTYTGPIRWGDEEVLWTDIFNSTKTANDYLQYLKKISNKVLVIESENQRELLSIEVDDAFSQIHTFECRFGDIRSLQVISSMRVDLRLKNDFVYHLRNGSNDVGTELQVLDENLGRVKLPWDKIRKVEFMEAKTASTEWFGEPLTGTVHTIRGTFSGQIEWDQDERLTTDILNGETENEKMGIPFGTIRSIIKQEDGSQVVMATGDEYLLRGSNDVNSDNRGIIVTIKGLGRVEVPWEAFVKVIFNDDIPFEGLGYTDFSAAEPLKGTVYTRQGTVLSGGIVFDMDEAFDTEFLQGKSNEIEYQIPFRNVATIVPLDERSSEITLQNGEKLTLGNMQDVSRANDGVLIYQDTSSLIKINWFDVMEIRFR